MPIDHTFRTSTNNCSPQLIVEQIKETTHQIDGMLSALQSARSLSDCLQALSPLERTQYALEKIQKTLERCSSRALAPQTREIHGLNQVVSCLNDAQAQLLRATLLSSADS